MRNLKTETVLMAEREGFEPSTGVASTRFPVVLLRPLGHLSATKTIPLAFRTATGPYHLSRFPIDTILTGGEAGIRTLG
jgi:hypothetical protein